MQGLNTLKIFLNDNVVYELPVEAKSTFEPSPSIKLKNLAAIALQSTIVRLLQPFVGGVGKIKVRLSHSCRLGYYVNSQTYMTDVEAGVNDICSDGDVFTITNSSGVEHVIHNVDNRDILVCFYLKTGKMVEILEM